MLSAALDSSEPVVTEGQSFRGCSDHVHLYIHGRSSYRHDPRFKQPSNFYLAIMLFLTWFDRRIKRSRLPYQIAQVTLNR